MSERADSSLAGFDPARRAALLQRLRGETTDDGILADAAREYLKGKLPFRDGEVVETRGRVKEPVRIRRDTWGIAHVQAENEADLFFALGYAMAQERLWQLDYQRRLVRGELCRDARTPLAGERPRACASLGWARRATGRGRRPRTTSGWFSKPWPRASIAGPNRSMSRLPVRVRGAGLRAPPLAIPPIRSPSGSTAPGRTAAGIDLIALAELARQTLPPSLAEAFFDVELADETIVAKSEDSSHDATHASPNGHGGGALDEGSNNWSVGGDHTTTGAGSL